MTLDDDDSPDVIRSPSEVARRSLVLFAPVRAALGVPRETAHEWLVRNGLAADLTPVEAAYLANPAPAERESINFSWQSERLIVLLWALGAVELPPPDEQCDTMIFQSVLPPYANVDVAAFLTSARLRPDAELLAMADHMLNLHWEARDARINNRTPSPAVDIGIIQERHHAINWIIGYCGLPWDEVTTDT